jgi:hypothetical protein
MQTFPTLDTTLSKRSISHRERVHKSDETINHTHSFWHWRCGLIFLLPLLAFRIFWQAHTTMETSSHSRRGMFVLSPPATSVKDWSEASVGSPPPLKLNHVTPTTSALSPRGISSALPLIPDDFDDAKQFSMKDGNRRKPSLSPRPLKQRRTCQWHPEDFLGTMPTSQQKVFLPVLEDSDDDA